MTNKTICKLCVYCSQNAEIETLGRFNTNWINHNEVALCKIQNKPLDIDYVSGGLKYEKCKDKNNGDCREFIHINTLFEKCKNCKQISILKLEPSTRYLTSLYYYEYYNSTSEISCSLSHALIKSNLKECPSFTDKQKAVEVKNENPKKVTLNYYVVPAIIITVLFIFYIYQNWSINK